jgi:hypothetical protein
MKERRMGWVGLNSRVDIMKENFKMDNLTVKENIILQILENYMKANLKIIIWMEKEL